MSIFVRIYGDTWGKRTMWPWCAAKPRGTDGGRGGGDKKKRRGLSEVNVKMSSSELSSMPLWEGLMVANLAQKETFI